MELSTARLSLSFLLGLLFYKLDNLLFLLMFLLFIDYLTGILCAIKEKQLSSQIAKWGFVSKLIMLICVAICYRIDILLTTKYLIRNMCIVWFAISEGISLLENAALLGVSLPDGIIDILIQFKSNTNVSIKNIIKKIIDEKKES